MMQKNNENDLFKNEKMGTRITQMKRIYTDLSMNIYPIRAIRVLFSKI